VSDRALRRTIAGVALLGLAIAGYLTYVHYRGIHVLCLAHGGCETVQSSDYAKLAGVPVALLGLIGYAGILVTLLLPVELGVAGGAVLAMIGFGFSAYLTYRELFTIKAICQWCVASAVLMTVLLGLTLFRALRTPEVQT
jgi:uncharacterized membrane protein